MTAPQVAGEEPADTATLPAEEVEHVRKTRPRTNEDDMTLVGSVLGGLATTWLLYERVLPFSGALGFFVSWYLVFLAFYAGLTA
ncbi:MAG: putative phosphate transporter permease protein, partial [Marmoricola sp.]|nr:putative phosphate transporter permease protein [Marmoricola sp.]